MTPASKDLGRSRRLWLRFVRLRTPPLAIAEDSQEDDVEDVARLGLCRFARAREVVGEHGAVDQVAQDVGNALRGHVTNSSFRDQRAPDVLPSLGVVVPVFK